MVAELQSVEAKEAALRQRRRKRAVEGAFGVTWSSSEKPESWRLQKAERSQSREPKSQGARAKSQSQSQEPELEPKSQSQSQEPEPRAKET